MQVWKGGRDDIIGHVVKGEAVLAQDVLGD